MTTSAGITEKINFLNFFYNVKYEHLIAGISGGLTSTLLLQPLDVIKIRFAVNDGIHNTPRYSGMLNLFSYV